MRIDNQLGENNAETCILRGGKEVMTTGSIAAFHTAIADLHRLVSYVLQSDTDISYIADHPPSNDLCELKAISGRIIYVYSDNLGCGSGHSIVIRKLVRKSADYHVVLNPDIYWNEDVVKGLIRFMESHADCDLTMPRVLHPSRSIQYLCELLPIPTDLFGRQLILLKSYQMKHNVRSELYDSGYGRIVEIPPLLSCFMFIRVNVLKKVGGFGEHFFMYAEDSDLCRRMGEVSKTMYYPVVSIYHEYEKGLYRNKRPLEYRICSATKYFNKWGWAFDKERTLKSKERLEKLSLISRRRVT